MSTPLIGLDWGSTQLRAYRFGTAGDIVETRVLAHGIRQLPAGGFAAAFELAVAGWPAAPVIACGMVGSRDGWREVAYLDAPATPEQLAQSLDQLATPDGRRCWLVPGLRDPHRPDVMRGEETQLAGLLAQSADSACVLLPGTHSKWARAEHGAVLGFATAMTGELYELLLRHSLLGFALPPQTDDTSAFRCGLTAARASAAAGGLSRLFSVRALRLDGQLAPHAVADYLSGLLIGEELRMALAADWVRHGECIWLAGEPALCRRYASAATLFGLDTQSVTPDIAAHGLWHIAGLAGLIAHAT